MRQGEAYSNKAKRPNAFYKSTCYALKYFSSSIYSKFNAFNCELMRTNVKKDYNKRNLSCYKSTVVSLVTEPISLPKTESCIGNCLVVVELTAYKCGDSTIQYNSSPLHYLIDSMKEASCKFSF
ncbi:hypothetical protein T05_4531, partial [Trichinella murrelli]